MVVDRHTGVQGDAFNMRSKCDSISFNSVPLSVGDDFDAVLVPGHLGVLLLHADLELDLVVLHAFLRLELARELVREFCANKMFLLILLSTDVSNCHTSNGDVAGRLVLALLAELLDLAGVLAGVLQLGLLDLERLLALHALDDDPGVVGLDLLAVLVPLDLRLRVVRLALELQLPLCLTVLLLLQLLVEAVGRIAGWKYSESYMLYNSDQSLSFKFALTFNLQIALAGKVVALPDHARVPAAVVHLGVLDGDGERVLFLHLERVLGTLVALLKIKSNYSALGTLQRTCF